MVKRIFKTRHFIRWMRKTELSDKALCEAVLEMARGLIDVDLGGSVVRSRCQAEEKVAARGRWWRRTKTIVGSLCLALRRTSAPTSVLLSWKHCRISHMIY